ncbi:hypothetical protein [Nocardia rhizosphaerae]|uniref:Uncharacterized protein n=1 Tax=Nocardia rhizosphaerae TaxID=1691571 RepID=A0ABV8LDM2_9NOCA
MSGREQMRRTCEAVNLSLDRFSVRAGIHINTIKKWCNRKETITLRPEHAARMNRILAAATRAQRILFHKLQTQRAVAPCALEVDDDPAIWKSSCENVADDLARKDLLVDRREVATTLLGVVAGTYLLEPLERWLREQRDTAATAPVITGTGTQELDELERAARLFREWDDKFGGGLRRKAVVGQFSEVYDMVSTATNRRTRTRPPRARPGRQVDHPDDARTAVHEGSVGVREARSPGRVPARRRQRSRRVHQLVPGRRPVLAALLRRRRTLRDSRRAPARTRPH